VPDQTTLHATQSPDDEAEGPSNVPNAAATPHSPCPENMERVYVEHYNLLLYVACRKFRVPEPDAEGLIQEVFVSYISAAANVKDIRAWLVAATCNASRHYWRTRSRTESLPDDIGERSDPLSHGIADSLATKLAVTRTLGYLQEKCRETLYLHYFEGCSAVELAKELDTTNRYAEKLIHNCMKRAREIFMTLNSVKR
jgi:RNA polymerase sigma factor (sigma-70 family)